MPIGILGTGVRVLRPGHYSERSPNESGEEHGESDRENDNDSDSERVSSSNDNSNRSNNRSSSSNKGGALWISTGQEPRPFM